MTEIITYRLTGTGVWGYEFFDMEHNQIGFVRNALSRAEPVRIEGPGCSWYSRFGLDARNTGMFHFVSSSYRGVMPRGLFSFWGIWYYKYTKE